MNIDILIFNIGSILMACISIGLVLWGLKSKQFEDNDYLKHKPLEEEWEET